MKKVLFILSTILMLTVIIVGATICASAEIIRGECGVDGDNVTWTLDTESSELILSGNGEMTNLYSSMGDYPEKGDLA